MKVHKKLFVELRHVHGTGPLNVPVHGQFQGGYWNREARLGVFSKRCVDCQNEVAVKILSKQQVYRLRIFNAVAGLLSLLLAWVLIYTAPATTGMLLLLELVILGYILQFSARKIWHAFTHQGLFSVQSDAPHSAKLHGTNSSASNK
jgi:hypothetical protein